MYIAPSKATSAEQQKLEVETNLNYLMATILYRLAHTLKTPPSYTDAQLSQRQVATAEGFQAVTNQSYPQVLTWPTPSSQRLGLEALWGKMLHRLTIVPTTFFVSFHTPFRP